jgi:superoxide dismutase, Cu-Zn family
MRGWILGVPLVLILAGAAKAADLTATMYRIDTRGTGEAVGTVTVSSDGGGAVFTTDLEGLPAGRHGFHVHANGDCGPGPNDAGLVVAGGAAGSHWDPEGTRQHRGPQGGGHLGDLPALDVAADGTAKERLPAPRITDLDRLKGHALMIHAGDDNYADQPLPLGGGGGRIACGVLRQSAPPLRGNARDQGLNPDWVSG